MGGERTGLLFAQGFNDRWLLSSINASFAELSGRSPYTLSPQDMTKRARMYYHDLSAGWLNNLENKTSQNTSHENEIHHRPSLQPRRVHTGRTRPPISVRAMFENADDLKPG